MQHYFASYRESVIKDALPGFTEFAKNTLTKSSQFNNFSEYLTYTTNAIIHAINTSNKPEAMKWIREHQFAVKSCFEKMVEGYKNPLEYGWKSFKFSKTVVEFDKFTLVPDMTYTSNKPVIYGSEMEILAEHPSKDLIAPKLLDIKSKGSCFIRIEAQNLRRHELATVNKDTVIDWTGVI